MTFANPPLTDDEVCRKFGITRNHVGFGTARMLSDFRPDRGISEWPNLRCPHCGEEMVLAVEFVAADWNQGDAIVCGECERVFWIEYIDTDDLSFTLCTHPESEG